MLYQRWNSYCCSTTDTPLYLYSTTLLLTQLYENYDQYWVALHLQDYTTWCFTPNRDHVKSSYHALVLLSHGKLLKYSFKNEVTKCKKWHLIRFMKSLLTTITGQCQTMVYIRGWLLPISIQGCIRPNYKRPVHGQLWDSSYANV